MIDVLIPEVQPTLAYIDPGTGSLVIQVLIAGLVGGLFTLKVYWKKVTRFLSKLRRKDGK